MPSVGPQSPGTCANDTLNGFSWSNPSNAAASDDSHATCNQPGVETSDYLVLTNFDFSSIPDGSTIDGIACAVEWSISEEHNCNIEARLVHGGSPLGAMNKSDGVSLRATTDATTNFGGAADTWGASPTAAQVKASTFGVRIICQDDDGSGYDYQVDHATLTVTYTEAVVSDGTPNLLLLGVG